MLTSASGIRYPQSSDTTNVWQYWQNQANDIDGIVKISVATPAARNAITNVLTGLLCHEQSTNCVYVWTGTKWQLLVAPPAGYSGSITAGSLAPANGSSSELTVSTVTINDPGYTYRLDISGGLIITQNVNDARIDMRVYDNSTLIAATTKASTEVNNQYSTEMAARVYPNYSSGGLLGARTLQLRIGRNITAATTAFAVVADSFSNHFTVRVLRA